MSPECQSLFFNQSFNNRVPFAYFIDSSNYKIGKNLIENRLTFLNNNISYAMLNLEYPSYQVKCKEMFIEINY